MSNVKEYTKEYLEKHIKPLLKVGARIKIGKHYADEIGGFKPGEVITLIEGHFDYDNGLYTVDQTTPSVWNEDAKEFDSIYHLFGNHLENFFDCEVLTETPLTQTSGKVIISSAQLYRFLSERMEFWKAEVKIVAMGDELIIDGFKGLLCNCNHPFECAIATEKLRQLRRLLGAISDQPITIAIDGLKLEIHSILI